MNPSEAAVATVCEAAMSETDQMENEAMRAFIAVLAILLAGGAAAGDWVYPAESIRGADGIERFPTTDGRLFDSIFEREAYLRQQRDAARQARRLERSAGPIPAADEPERWQKPIPGRSVDPATALADPMFSPLPATGDPETDQRRLDEAIARARAIRNMQRRQDTLSSLRRGDRAATRGDIATARTAQQRRTARGADRLQAGAAAARATLGERETRPRGPLIRMPVVEMP